MNRRILLPAVPAVALLALGLTGCGSDDGSSASDDTRPASSTTTPTTPAPVSPESEAPVVSEQQTVGFPEDVDLPEHGGHYWTVVLSPFDTRAEVEQSVEDVKVYGYDAAIGELGCIDGVAEVTAYCLD